MKSVVYIELENIKNNGVFDCLKKALALEARKLQSIDELFLATKRGSRDSMKRASSVAKWKNNCPTGKIKNQLILNFFEQILLFSKACPIAESEISAF